MHKKKIHINMFFNSLKIKIIYIWLKKSDAV